jgi:hypothetical protein
MLRAGQVLALVHERPGRFVHRFPDSEILWRTVVLGHVVGNQDVDEALGVWYPSHQAFLNLMSAPASSENMRLRVLAVEHRDLHRCQVY